MAARRASAEAAARVTGVPDLPAAAWSRSFDDVATALGTDIDTGLPHGEAARRPTRPENAN
jgi:hypothetical protein